MTLQLRDAYELLGVTPEDDEKTVKRAWRALVRSYHPDLARTDPEAATRKLAEINAAFDLLCLRPAKPEPARTARAHSRKPAPAKQAKPRTQPRRDRETRDAQAQANARARAKASPHPDAKPRAHARKPQASTQPSAPAFTWSPARRSAARKAQVAFQSALSALHATPDSKRRVYA